MLSLNCTLIKSSTRLRFVSTMKAVQVHKSGNTSEMYIANVPKPSLRNGEIIIKVKYSGVNRADIQQKLGRYPPPPGESEILGLEVAGIVDQVDKSVRKWKVGDYVMALLSGGGYAEYVSIPESLAIPIPNNITFDQAAGIPETFITTYHALFRLGNVKCNQHVLFHGGASGIGISAIQLAKQVPGVFVSTTAGSSSKCEFCSSLGADFVWNYNNGPFDEAIVNSVGRGVDFVLDFVGQRYFQQNLKLMNPNATLVFLAMLSGSKCENMSIGPILSKNLTICGTTLRNKPLQYRSELIQSFTDNTLGMFEAGKLKPIIDRVYPLEQVAQAHELMEQNANIGKLVLQIC